MSIQSFSAGAKGEICREIPQRSCCAVAECLGISLFCHSFHAGEIRVVTESVEFAKMLPKLYKKAFGLTFDVLPSGEGKQVFQITDSRKIRRIMDAFGFQWDKTTTLHLNLPIVEESCCKTAFLRGVFLAGGSVTDPAKRYHLELATSHQIAARECSLLIHECVGLDAKIAQRQGSAVLYFKQSDAISDFLAFLGAPVAAMGIIETKLEKELNNKVNRCVNCDEANTSKVVEAAQEQLAAIRILYRHGAVETLPPKLLQALKAREENPEASLSELAELMEPPITKPAMNHRLKKLLELAKELCQ